MSAETHLDTLLAAAGLTVPAERKPALTAAASEFLRQIAMVRAAVDDPALEPATVFVMRKPVSY